jgi:AraC-like DNA-binding protein
LNVAHAVAHGDFGRACLYALDRGMVPHAHREGHLIFHLDGPRAEMVVDDASVSLDPGQGVAISPWQPHYCRTVDSSRHVLMLVIYLKADWFGRVCPRPQDDFRFGRVDVAVTEPIARLVQRIRFLLSDHWISDTPLDECMTSLATAAHDQTWQRTRGMPGGSVHVPRAADFRIRRAIRLMDETVGDNIDLAAISRAAGLSRPHFFKLFREQIGVPPTLYLNALRIERAIDRLAGGQENVADIGLDLGFSTAASFSRFFAANSVVPPSAYRRSVHTRALLS